MPPEAICQLCLASFGEDEIEKAKKLLHEVCEDKSAPRIIVRKGSKKKAQNMDDIIKFIHDKGSDLPIFVALNLQALPPVTFNSLDVSSLLHTIKQTQAEVSLLKEGLTTQAESIRDLYTVVENRSESGATAAVCSADETVSAAVHSVEETSAVAATVHSVEKTSAVSAVSCASSKTLSAGESYKSVNSGLSAMAQAEDKSVKQAGSALPQAASVQSYAGQVEEWKKMEKVHGKLRVMPVNNASQSSRAAAGHKPRSSSGKFVSGSVKQSGLSTVKKSKYASVFASRFDTSVSGEMLKSYLEEKLNLKVQVSPVKTRYDTYHSFHVMSECENPKVFMDETVWPEGAYVRWWKGSFVGRDGASSNAQ